MKPHFAQRRPRPELDAVQPLRDRHLREGVLPHLRRDSYGFLHSQDGHTTIINKKSGDGAISFRSDNGEIMRLDDAGNLAVAGTVKGKELALECVNVHRACTTTSQFTLTCPAGYTATSSGWEPCVNWETGTSWIPNNTQCNFYANVQNTWQGFCRCCRVK